MCEKETAHNDAQTQNSPLSHCLSFIRSQSHRHACVHTQYYVNSLFGRVLLSLSEHPLGHLGSLIKTRHSIH